MTLPPRPWGIITLPAARQSSQLWRTLASITASQSAGSWSTMGLGMLVPGAGDHDVETAARLDRGAHDLRRRPPPSPVAARRWRPIRRRRRWPAATAGSFSTLPPASVTCAPGAGQRVGGLLAERTGGAGDHGRAPGQVEDRRPGAAAVRHRLPSG